MLLNNTYLKCAILVLAVTMLTACGGEKKRPVFYDNDDEEALDTVIDDEVVASGYEETHDADVISVPFTEKGGVKYVRVSVNGFGFEMIFDTGCSGTLISVAEANYLYQKGYLSMDDVIGIEQSQIADGSIVENMVVNLREVIIDGKIRCTDVAATVSTNNNAPLLLGNEILNRVASYSVDNQNCTINFNLK